MSDGISDSYRDSKIVDKIKEVRRLQGRFLEDMSSELAKEIIDKLNVIKIMPRGAFNGVNQYRVEQDIEYYTKYLENKNNF